MRTRSSASCGFCSASLIRSLTWAVGDSAATAAPAIAQPATTDSAVERNDLMDPLQMFGSATLAANAAWTLLGAPCDQFTRHRHPRWRDRLSRLLIPCKEIA